MVFIKHVLNLRKYLKYFLAWINLIYMSSFMCTGNYRFSFSEAETKAQIFCFVLNYFPVGKLKKVRKLNYKLNQSEFWGFLRFKTFQSEINSHTLTLFPFHPISCSTFGCFRAEILVNLTGIDAMNKKGFHIFWIWCCMSFSFFHSSFFCPRSPEIYLSLVLFDWSAESTL